MSTFMQYAMVASSEALDDAAWRPNTDQQCERTVSQDAFTIEHHDDPAKPNIRAYV